MRPPPVPRVTLSQDFFARVRTGDLAAFEALYRSLYQDVWDFAFRYLQSAEEAEDLVHDIFASLWERRSALPSDVQIESYIFAAVRNQALQRVRHAYVVRHAAAGGDVPEWNASVPQPDDELQHQERIAHVRGALQKLSQAQRDILILRWYRGMSYQQIAGVLGVSLDAAKQQGSRAQRALGALIR